MLFCCTVLPVAELFRNQLADCQQNQPSRSGRTQEDRDTRDLDRGGFCFLRILIALSFSLQLSASLGFTTPSQQKRPAVIAEAGTESEHQLSGAEIHSYLFKLSTGQLLYVCADQLGIDVVASLYSPDGANLFTINRYSRGRGTEQIWWVAETTGAYRLQVRSQDRDGVGSYRLRVMPLREASEDDRSHASVQRLFAEGWQLREQRTPPALREAIGKFERVLTYWQGTGNQREQANLLNILGGLHHRLNDDHRAFDSYEKALPLWKALKDGIGEAWTLNDIGDIYFAKGERQKALDYFEHALRLYQAVGLRREQAVALTTVAKAYASLGERQKALDALRQALPYWRWKSDRLGEAQAFHLMGEIYVSIGDRTQALSSFNQSLQIRQAIRDRNGQAATLNKIGELHASLGDFDRALPQFRKALEIARSLGNRREEALISCNIAGMKLPSGNAAQAVKEFGLALAVFQALHDPVGEALVLRQLGQAHLALGSPEQAIDLGQRALALLRGLGDVAGETETLLLLARAYRGLGRLEPASIAIEAALDQIESQRTRIEGPETRIVFLASVRDYYDFCIDLLMQRHRENPAGGYAAAAFATSERARARSLVEAFLDSGAVTSGGLSPELLTRKRTLLDSLGARPDSPAEAGVDKAEVAAAEAREMESLLAQYRDVERQIQTARLSTSSGGHLPRIGLAEIQNELLDDKTMLLEYALGEERSYLWAVTPDSLATFELPKRRTIEQAAREFYELLTERNRRLRPETEAERSQRLLRAERLLPNAAAELSRMLLGPVTDQLNSKRLLIVGEGSLQYLPFTALPAPAALETSREPRTNAAREVPINQTTSNNRSIRAAPWDALPLRATALVERSALVPLARQHEVVYLPSASAQLTWRREFGRREPAPKLAAILADPVFEQDDPRVRQSRALHSGKTAAAQTFLPSATPDSQLVQSELKQALRDVELLPRTQEIPRLFYSRQEAMSILSLLPQDQRRAALDFEASRSTATGAELSQYRIIHFATHSLVNSPHPHLSGLVFSLVDEAGRPQEGFLRLRDVYDLKLPADLVVLSACQTGLGRVIRGEGLIGLTRGFMAAGAARVVSSLWKVDDRATAELMKRFYQAMLGEHKLSPSAALRAAQLSLAKEKVWESPYYWAGFVLQGEWR